MDSPKITVNQPEGPFGALMGFVCAELAFVITFALMVLNTLPQDVGKRAIGMIPLAAGSYAMESSIVQLCLDHGRPQWAAIVTALLWVQLLNASDLLMVLKIDATQVRRICRPKSGTINVMGRAMGLLFNSRRVGTPWQVKNIPSTTGLRMQSRKAFILKRIAVTLLAYIFVDLMISMPPPPPEHIAIGAPAAVLIPVPGLHIEAYIFRFATTVSYWATTAMVVLATNNFGAIAAVLFGSSTPADCPPPLGSFFEAHTVRRFWGISWHQMLRSSLTGHANVIIAHIPFVASHSAIARHLRLMFAFTISGLIHWRADQLQGVPNSENGALTFFLLQGAVIILEDVVGPVLIEILPTTKRLRYFLGYLWVLLFFAWTSPIYMFPGMRLGSDEAALLPFRILGSKTLF